jgi:hypothetical protein
MAKGIKTGGRKPGSRNKQLTPDELRAKVEAAELKARLRMAKAGVVLTEVAKQTTYVPQIKPGHRDLTDRFARIQCAIDELQDLEQIKRERAGHPDMAEVPGGRSGLVTFTYVRSGEHQYSKASRFDAALDAAIESKLAYISKELGQFSPDIEVLVRKDGAIGQKAPPDYQRVGG